MSDIHRETVSASVTAEMFNHHGERGPWVVVQRQMSDGVTIHDLYTPAGALRFAEALTRAAREAS